MPKTKLQLLRFVQNIINELKGHAIDLARLNGMGSTPSKDGSQSQFDQYSSLIKSRAADIYRVALEQLQENGFIIPCDCLAKIVQHNQQAQLCGVDFSSNDFQRHALLLLANKNDCRICHGTGFMNTLNIEVDFKPAPSKVLSAENQGLKEVQDQTVDLPHLPAELTPLNGGDKKTLIKPKKD